MKMKRNINKDRTIGSKVSIIMVAAILISTLTIGIFCYYSYRDNALKLSGERAVAIAESIASGIDGDKFATYDKTGVKDQYYNQIQTTLDEIKRRNGASFIYTFADAGENYKYIVSGYLKDEDRKEWGYLGYTDPKSFTADEADYVYKDGVSRYTKPIDYGEGYGTIVSGLAPVLDSDGNVVGIAGADLDVDALLANINKIIPIMAIMILLITAILSAVSYIFINSTVSRPLKGIAAKSKTLVLGDTDFDLYILLNSIGTYSIGERGSSLWN